VCDEGTCLLRASCPARGGGRECRASGTRPHHRLGIVLLAAVAAGLAAGLPLAAGAAGNTVTSSKASHNGRRP
jgi:hypothetical protein